LDVAMGSGARVDPRALPLFIFDDSARTITIKPGAWKLDRTVVLPSGYRCVATSPLRLDIVNGAELISYSRLEWKGMQDMPIAIFSTDSSSHGVHVVGASGMSRLAHVNFGNLTRYKYDQDRSGDVSFHRSNVTMDHCFFTGTGATLLDVSVGTLDLRNSRFDHGSDQLEAHYAQIDLEDVIFELSADDAISINGGAASLKKIAIGGGGGIGVKGAKSAQITIDGLKLDRMATAFEGREGSRISVSNGALESVGLVAEAKEREMRYGAVTIELLKVSIVKATKEFECGAGSTITLDGKRVGETKVAKGT